MTATDYHEDLRRAITTAKNPPYSIQTPADLGAAIFGLPDWDRDRLANVLALALFELVQPARIGNLDGVAEDITEALFDNAHEGCDDEDGCTGGGRLAWQEYVRDLIVPVLREHAVLKCPHGYERGDHHWYGCVGVDPVAAAGNRTERIDLMDLVTDLAEKGACDYDHHGSCQEHGWMKTDPACPHGRAQRLLTARGGAS